MDSNAVNMFNSLLSNPDALNNIKDMFNNINGENKLDGNFAEKTSGNDDNKSNQPDMTFIIDLINKNQNKELLRKVSNAYSAYSSNSSPGIGLLEALSPYLSSKRSANLEMVKNVIRMTNAVSEFNRK